MSQPLIKPFGSWKSPISARQVAASALGLSQVQIDGANIYWNEMRPLDGGRHVIVRYRGSRREDALPTPFSARTRAHEYGGAAFCVAHDVIYFCNDADQRLYRLLPGQTPQALTPEINQRYADLVVDHRRRRILCVAEDHRLTGAPVNRIVAVAAAGCNDPTVLISGNDFYAAPRLSPDGSQLAWLAWDHPNMPWDESALWLADIGADGLPNNQRCIAGGCDESILQPCFAPDAALYFISDRNNWWNLYRWRHDRVETLAPMEAEFGSPPWVFGMSSYAFASDKRVICAFNQQGTWRLAALNIDTLEQTPVETPFTDISYVNADENVALFIAASPVMPPSIVRMDLATRRYDILHTSNNDAPRENYLSVPQTLSYPTSQNDIAHAFYYPPLNQDFRARAAELPPLLVLSHGGPTAAASSALNLKIQYWTSRGFAVLDVNYRGSTGYGRKYRQRLNGQWGVMDVEDCIAGARYLIEQQRVDAKRLAIRGGSAGGFTTLCALCLHDFFQAGAVYYGVSDLEALAKDTHKFEARYLDRLVGPYPARADIYRARSPIHHVECLASPVIFFQGLDDKVVPPNQTEKMVTALRAKHIPVAYVAFAGESHGFRRAQNIQQALEAELYFYSRLFGFESADALTPVAIENLNF
ncbi:MAG: S9 family peptidase [Gammaproteobacteria bacterium]|nr:S9 family peptidase [Gammaproteobacteria bacterium]